jgi:hypothetical protein
MGLACTARARQGIEKNNLRTRRNPVCATMCAGAAGMGYREGIRGRGTCPGEEGFPTSNSTHLLTRASGPSLKRGHGRAWQGACAGEEGPPGRVSEPRVKRGRDRALRSLAACSLLHSLQILQTLQDAAAVCHPAARLPPYLRLRGGGYAYQKPGRRPYVERHTPGQVDARDVPHMTEDTIDPLFDVDKQRWYTGTVENPKEFWGLAGPPPLPDDVPEVVKLALGDRINRPINVEIAMSWVLATDTRLKERLSRPRHDRVRPQICNTCLGPEPSKVYVHQLDTNAVCRICDMEYSQWRFRPRTADVRLKVRSKKTIICRHCAKGKDVCQVCIFDMKYGLPVKLRDKLVARSDGLLPTWAARLLPSPPAYLQVSFASVLGLFCLCIRSLLPLLGLFCLCIVTLPSCLSTGRERRGCSSKGSRSSGERGARAGGGEGEGGGFSGARCSLDEQV